MYTYPHVRKKVVSFNLNISNFILRKTTAIVHLIDWLHVTSKRFSFQPPDGGGDIIQLQLYPKQISYDKQVVLKTHFFYCAYNIRTNVSILAHKVIVMDLCINKHVWAQQISNYNMHANTNVQFCNFKIQICNSKLID